MKWLDLGDSIGRFRFAESCVGLAGCLSICYAVWTPCWLSNRGLWTDWENSEQDQQTWDDSDRAVYNVPEAQRVFAFFSFLMALSCGALCLVFALCWTSDTVHSYSNTRSLLMVGQALYPTTLLLFTLASTGLLFLLCWSLFTYHHREEIRQDIASLGSSYWLGAVGWALLLIIQPTVFLVEQCVVPDILPDLENSIETWRRASLQKRAFSEGGCHPGNYKVDDSAGLRRNMSEP